MSVTEFSQLILAISLSFAIVGISIQIIRLLGTTNATMRDARHIAYQVSDILSSVKTEIDNIRELVANTSARIEVIQESILEPMTKTSAIIGGVFEFINSKIVNR